MAVSSNFKALPDNPTVDTIDHIIAIATTQTNVRLQNLSTLGTIQQIIDTVMRGTEDKGSLPSDLSFPISLWTAVTIPLMIRKI